ncbi:MAG: hypothetical protein JXB38_15680 [Anaerolineales bacterium]|nr:hypothetical protein [Anaerolineales bacterium]
MGKSEYRKIVAEKARKKLKVKIFNELGWLGLLIVGGFSGGLVYAISRDEFISLLTGLIPTSISIIVLYLKWNYKDIPEEIYKWQEKRIKELEIKFIKPKLDFRVLPFSETGMENERYASNQWC